MSFPPISTGQIIGSYRIIRLLGEGGMGAVYEALHTTLNRRCAIKVLHPQYAGDPITAARFLQEAKAANRVQHPGVVQIFEFGQFADGRPYFVMEYLEGDTLSTRLQRAAQQPAGRLGFPGLVTCWAIAKVCAIVHKQGLIHRDLKPANIMIVADSDLPGGERIKLLDFGIVKATHASTEAPSSVNVMTRTGSVMGTPHYMAPEQWRSQKNIDGKVDVYALGVIHFQILSGGLPFDHDDLPVLAMMHCFNAAPLLTVLDPSLPKEVEVLGSKMLEKDPTKRPTMSEVAGALGRILGMVSDAEHRPPPLPIEKPVTPTSTARVNVEPRTLNPSLLKSRVSLAPPPPADAERHHRNPEPFTSSVAPTLRPTHGRSGRVLLLLALGISSSICAWAVFQKMRQTVHPPSLSIVEDLHSAEDAAALPMPPDLSMLPDLATVQILEDLAMPPDLAPAQHPELRSVPHRPDLAHHYQPHQPPPKQCVPILPTELCIIGPNLTMNQRELIVKAFKKSDAKLCVGERLGLSGLPATPRVSTVLPSMERVSGSTRALTLTLRGLLGGSEFPSQVEVRCLAP